MSLKQLVTRYIAAADHVLATIEIVKDAAKPRADSITKVVESARAYLEDAKYFREKEKFEVSLTSVAYCEGLLDALRLLGAVKFEWPLGARVEEEK